MNKNLVVPVGLLILIGVSFTVIRSQKTSKIDTMMEKATGQNDVMEPINEDLEEGDGIMMKNLYRYSSYSKTAFDAAKGKKRVYFFHAPWCPTCQAADAEFQADIDTIPKNVEVFKTDYDSSKELKQKYSITYQHTFVQVDENGQEVTKWNGGGLEELIANTK